MGKANMFYNARDRRWEVRGRSGTVLATFTDDGYNKDFEGKVIAGVASLANSRVERIKIGGGATISLMTKLTGTIALAAIGTGAVAVATVTGLGSAGITVGDIIHAVPKGNLSGIGIVGYRIPTTNVVNVYVVNPSDQGGGSLPAVGLDLIQMRVAG